MHNAGRTMLDFKIDSLDQVSDDLKSLYTEKDGAYFLNVSGLPEIEDVSGLKASHEKLLAEKKEQQRKAQEAEAERKRIEEESARKNGDLEAIEKSWAEKYANREAELSTQSEALRKQVYNLTVGEQAIRLAAKLGTQNSQRILAKEIKERLTLSDDGNVRVLDSQGQLSALTIADLEKELMTSSEYADMVVGSRATGGGAVGGFGGGATKQPNEMSEAERTHLYRTDIATYRKLFGKK